MADEALFQASGAEPDAAASHVIALDDPSLYINRELSWLEFNQRVLEEAESQGLPLLESPAARRGD